jgi:RND family efflux transporter MFP subunit
MNLCLPHQRVSPPPRQPAALAMVAVSLMAILVADCGGGGVHAEDGQGPTATVTVGVTKLGRKLMSRQLTMSSELVPFQEIDVYAKESGFVRQLLVDYGSRVKGDQILAILEIPELEAQLQHDEAAVRNAADRMNTAQHEVSRAEAQRRVFQLQADRLTTVAKTHAGLVAQQEVDDAQGKDLAAEATVEAAQANLEAAQSALLETKANQDRDRVLFNYSKITAPFAGVVTQRFANLGTLVQAGTSSSTQAMPVVRLSEDDVFRLVIPVPESYVRYIHVGDEVSVKVPAVGRTLPGKITRFSVDVKEDTRTMHTEVDVPNPDQTLIAGVYAEATLTLDRRERALAVPLQAVNHAGDKTTVFIVNHENKLEERTVTLGVEAAVEAEVLSGLQEGDSVVVSDRGGLKPGEPVRPQVTELIAYQDEGSK